MDESICDMAYIENLPEWGRNSISPYISAVRLILQTLGRFPSFPELMGLSGLCFRFSLSSPSEHPKQIDLNESLLFHALGIARYTMLTPAAQLLQVKKSIQNGIPVLCFGLFGRLEWGLLTGYHQNQLYGKTCGSKLRRVDGFSSAALRLFDLPGKPLSEQESFTASLRHCVNSREPQQGEADYAAYFQWIFSLGQQTLSMEESRRLLTQLSGTRRTAAVYLRSKLPLYEEEKRRLLEGSAENCARIAAIAAASTELPPKRLQVILRQLLTLEKEMESNFRLILAH